MSLQLREVITDITGATGLAIIRAIVAGERDAVRLAQLRNPACKSSNEMIAKALTGTWKDAQLFVLEQALKLYEAYTQQIEVCNRRIEQVLKRCNRGAKTHTHHFLTSHLSQALQEQEPSVLQRAGAVCTYPRCRSGCGGGNFGWFGTNDYQ